jgi:hypothetical protein
MNNILAFIKCDRCAWVQSLTRLHERFVANIGELNACIENHDDRILPLEYQYEGTWQNVYLCFIEEPFAKVDAAQGNKETELVT